MHYKIAKNIIIKTENAAKPEHQRSAHLTSLISNLKHVSSSFDYGCGKLRYCDVILKSTDTLAVVDSEIQLLRVQTLRNKKTSIRALIDRSNRITTYNDIQFVKDSEQYDRGFCIKILSSIPIFRKRQHIIRLIHSRLQRNACCLFVVQYRNSDFTRMRSMPNAWKWRDGFVIDSLRGHSFYALIQPDRLIAMAKKERFAIENVHLNEGSVYLWAKRI